LSLLTLADARLTLEIDAADTSVNAELQHYVDAITTVVENHVSEAIDQRTVTERIRLRGLQPRFVLGTTPVLSLTSLTGITGTSWDISGLDIDLPTGSVEVFRGAIPYGTVIAVYQAGYVTPPENYKRGALIILQHIWETQRGVGQVLGGVVGAEERLNRTWMYEIPRKALEWLGTPAPGVG
jgi:hypothetical protein